MSASAFIKLNQLAHTVPEILFTRNFFFFLQKNSSKKGKKKKNEIAGKFLKKKLRKIKIAFIK